MTTDANLFVTDADNMNRLIREDSIRTLWPFAPPDTEPDTDTTDPKDAA